MYNLSRLDPLYIFEIHKFIDVVTNHAWRTKTKHIYCPCMDCKNIVVLDDKEQIISHHLQFLLYIHHHLLKLSHAIAHPLSDPPSPPQASPFRTPPPSPPHPLGLLVTHYLRHHKGINLLHSHQWIHDHQRNLNF
jgi:hypothetical protein